MEAAKIISTGGLAPDEMVLDLVTGWLDKSDGSFLFDGFPRTVTQAERLEVLLCKGQLTVQLAVLLEVADPVIRARMLRRLTCSNCGKVISMGRHVRDANDPCPNCGGKLEARADDNLGALARRMEQYTEKTVPVADFYRRRDILARVDAGRAAEAVFKDVSELIVG
jgi:adenylate kinase